MECVDSLDTGDSVVCDDVSMECVDSLDTGDLVVCDDSSDSGACVDSMDSVDCRDDVVDDVVCVDADDDNENCDNSCIATAACLSLVGKDFNDSPSACVGSVALIGRNELMIDVSDSDVSMECVAVSDACCLANGNPNPDDCLGSVFIQVPTHNKPVRRSARIAQYKGNWIH